MKNEIDIDYYKKVIETQNDYQILKSEFTDLVAELEEFFRNKGKCVNERIKALQTALQNIINECSHPESRYGMKVNLIAMRVLLNDAIISRQGVEVAVNNKEVVKLIDSWLKDKTGYDEKTWPEIKKEMALNCMECVPDCTSYDGGEKKHLMES